VQEWEPCRLERLSCVGGRHCKITWFERVDLEVFSWIRGRDSKAGLKEVAEVTDLRLDFSSAF